MSTSIPANMDLAAIVTVGGGIYMIHHCYAFDRFRCLLPSKKDWFRVLLTWMLVTSDLSLSIWAVGVCYLKHKYGYMDVPGVGIMATPPDLYSLGDTRIISFLDTCVCIALWLQVSLNAEEGLYWYHLMTAVRKPSSSRSWLNSSFFAAWIVISILTLIANQCSIWVNIDSEAERAARIYSVLGAIELTVALTASIVIIQFPKFLEDVRRSGAGREVRSRLYFYHEANKLRTFFRILFAVAALTLGLDGLTTAKKVNTTRWVAESLEQIAYTSYFLAMIVSVTLYLPRTYSSALADGKVMIGHQANRGGEDAVSNALMSLLREGAPWDEGDEKRAKGSNVDLKGNNDSDEWNKEPENRNDVLANFISPIISPIAVTPATNEMPTEIRIHIQQEVMQHAEGESMHVDPPSDLTVPKKWA